MAGLNGIKQIAAVVLALGVSMPAMQAPAMAHDAYFKASDSPECSDAKMLKRIAKRFKVQAKRIHHRADWRIDDVSNVHQHRYIPQDVHKARPIARRYCHGTAIFNDGEHRKIWYLIEGKAGFASYADNVEFCISGLDDANVYNAHCRLLR